MGSELFLRIEAGIHKNKKLLLPNQKTTRPTKSILKGSFFNSLQFELVDSIFIEAFAGSGLMGLEALSRGAKRAYFFEKEKEVFLVLKKNISLLNEENRSVAILGDTFELFDRFLDEFNAIDRAIFYFDPPFEIRSSMHGVYENCFELITKLKKAVAIALEHQSNLMLPNELGVFELKTTKRFGKSSLSMYRMKDE